MLRVRVCGGRARVRACLGMFISTAMSRTAYLDMIYYSVAVSLSKSLALTPQPDSFPNSSSHLHMITSKIPIAGAQFHAFLSAGVISLIYLWAAVMWS